jgi:Tol biopolymer transport system component
MTAIPQFDPFEERIVAAIDDLAAARRPDYLDDVLRLTATTPQRSRWSPSAVFAAARGGEPARPMARAGAGRLLVLVAILALLTLLGAFAIAGSRNDGPAPAYGPARNGEIAYAENGDLLVRDDPTAPGRVLVADGDIRFAPMYSPDGEWIAYPVSDGTGDIFWVARADGSDARPVHDVHIDDAYSWATWSPDSATIAITGTFEGRNGLLLANADGSGSRFTAFDGRIAWDVAFDPRDPGRLLLRLQERAATGALDLYTARADGSGLTPLGLRTSPRAFGAQFTLSGAQWSPAEDLVAYNDIDLIGDTLITAFRVRTINPDGTGDRPLPGPDDPNIQQGWPIFSPDGRWLVVHQWIWRGDGDRGDGWVAIMPADGSAPPRRIGPEVLQGDDTDTTKTWSPDGSTVIARYATGEVYAIDPFANTWELMPGVSDLPDWQRRAP